MWLARKKQPTRLLPTVSFKGGGRAERVGARDADGGVKKLLDPRLPSQKEVDEHNLTHLIHGLETQAPPKVSFERFRNWQLPHKDPNGYATSHYLWSKPEDI